ncbi:ammonium transporter [Sneathiella limimaris]|uniref:ammonium transporter n=1 Tax=Sneathiella limimaris TaxID=1964213 RepID=UPI00146EC514|nr:ammonium transporter [Sneathiella limimaris]
MRDFKVNKKTLAFSAAVLAMVPGVANAAVDPETAYIFNSFSFILNGALVMWMAAGFAMLEAGLVRKKNTATICLKNIALYSIAGLTFYLVGYNLMYMDVTGFIGSFSPFWGPDDADALAGTFADGGYSASSDWFFQMVFVATAASIVSGAVAERIKLWPFLAFVFLLTAIIYPIQGSWVWGGGWLSEMGFSDYAGSTLVHSVGGWAALTGAIILGARKGKYSADGKVQPIPGANLPLATLGTFILWLGWFGFNGGSVLALGSASAVIEMANVFANTNMAAVGGVLSAMILTQILYKKVDLTMALNGAIAGLVSITAEPADPSIGLSIIIGAVGGALVVFAVPLLDKLKIDDVVGAISAHLVAGIWGTLAVAISDADATFVVQATGIVAIGVFVIITSTILWLLLKYTVGIRADEEDEANGLDKAELGLEAYPEFGPSS